MAIGPTLNGVGFLTLTMRHQEMNPNQTPLWKLQRLKEITRALFLCPPIVPSAEIPPGTAALLEERDAILATVGIPPDDLFENLDPAAWAGCFSTMFPAFDTPTAYVWFRGAMAAASAQARAEHLLVLEGQKELIDTLCLVRDGLARGSIKASQISDPTRDGGKPRPLAVLIVEALAGVGVRQ